MAKKFAEFEIHDLAIEIVYKEIAEIKRKRERTDEDVQRLEKLVRMYSVLMDNLRSSFKDGLRDKLGPEAGED
jgi:predicted RNA binding protein with dsRBD fold (UPF0201 family)